MFVHIFDCDGVVLDTNRLKTDAFSFVAEKHLPIKVKNKLLEFHRTNLGKSRWEKFFFVKKYFSLKNLNIHELCEEYGNYVEQQMYKKKLIPNIGNYLKQINDADQNIIYVATGGETFQVRRLIKHHNLLINENHIFGSPTKKTQIVKDLKSLHPTANFILYGDSLHDAECAEIIKAKFIFVNGFTSSCSKKIRTKFPIDLEIGDFKDISLDKIKSFFKI